MALYHLSGDEMGSSKKKSKKNNSSTKPKTKKKKVAKIGLAPVRGAFLTVTELNLLKMGTKLARVWNKPGGKEKLTKWWTVSMKGDLGHLKKALSKGSKQTIAGSSMGIVAATVIATASAAIIAVAPIIKEFKGEGDKKEAKEFDDGVEKGVKDLAADPDVAKGTVTMPEDADVAKLKNDGTTNGSLGTNPVSICFLFCMMIPMMHLTNPFAIIIASIFYMYAFIGWLILPFALGIAGQKVKNISIKYFEVPASFVMSFAKKFHLSK